MNGEILAVGTELLLGNIVNTNAQFLSQELANIGVNVFYHSVVGDNFERVVNALSEGFSRSDLIITTGGLGPTKDDMTKEAVAKYFGKELVLFPEEKKILENLFSKRGFKVTENNYRQAYFPQGATIMPNNNGTAPGVIICENGKTLIMLPGPPREMKAMFTQSAIPFLKKQSDYMFMSKNLNFLGIGESALAEKVEHLIDTQTNPTIAPYAKEGYCLLRITAKGKSKEECEKIIEPTIKEIEKKVGKYIYGYDDELPEDALVRMLNAKKLTIATAESCTGGMIGSAIVNVSGASSVFLESLVTYSNEAKINRLGVSYNTLKKYGAVSEETAKEMALQLKKITGADICVSTTGIAGPTGDTQNKNVGLTYIGIAVNDQVYVFKYNFGSTRNDNRIRATLSTFNLLINYLKNGDFNA